MNFNITDYLYVSGPILASNELYVKDFIPSIEIT